MPIRRDAMLALVLGAGCLGGRAQGHSVPGPGVIWLVMPDEVGKYGAEVRESGAVATAPPPADLRPGAASTAGPAIVLLRPVLDAEKKLTSPFEIAVRFVRAADADIEPSSFKVLYGALGLDITSRIAGTVAVTPEGFTVPRAAVPEGRHRLRLTVQDSRKRTAELLLRLEVA